MPRRHLADRFVLGAAIAVLAVVTALRASVQQRVVSVPSTYDFGQNGYAALYELLAREHRAIDRFELPLGELPQRRVILVVAGDYQLLRVAPTPERLRVLDGWVRRGGTLEIFGAVPFWLRTGLGLPETRALHASAAQAGCGLGSARIRVNADFTAATRGACLRNRATLLQTAGQAVVLAYRRGRGTIVFSTTSTLLDNLHLAQEGNAKAALALLSFAPVFFEERGYGHELAKSIWQVLPQPMRVAIAIACAAVVLAIVGANIPFAPVLWAQDGDERDSSEYITSLAALLQRGHARGAIVRRLCEAVHAALGGRIAGDANAAAIVEAARELQSHRSPRAADVVAAGRLFARARREYPS